VTRAASIVFVLALAGGVVADPAVAVDDGAGPVDPVAVAGRYKTKLLWSGCDPAGAKTPVVSLAPIDGRLELDLGPARDGLSAIVVAGDSRSLTGTMSDVTATLAFGAKSAELSIELTSGCRARGTAKRETTGIAACDELVALARVEDGCGAIAPANRLEDVTAVDAEATSWAKAKGAKKKSTDAACSVRVAALRPALTDAACLAVPAEDTPTLLPECRDLAASIAKLSQCRALDATTRTMLRDMLGQISVHAVHTDAGSISVARQVCLRQVEELRELAPRIGC
jgi:hypothetical protein